MRQFKADGTTGDVSPIPYAAMAANGFAWTTYGYLGGDYTIITANVSGCLLGLYYCQQFYQYRSPAAVVLPYYGGGAAFCASAAAAAAMLPTAQAQTLIGYGGVAVCLAMFSGPLASIQAVIRDKSAASIPFAFTLASTANCTLWTSYGALVIHDPFVYGPNGLGLVASIVQLGLLARFGTGAVPK